MPQKKFTKIFLTLLLISSLSACSLFEPKIVEVPVEVRIEVPKVQRPKPVQLNDIHFYVVSDKNRNAFKAKYMHRNGHFTYIAISVKDYENLAKNTAELIRYMKDQKANIEYYENRITNVTKVE